MDIDIANILDTLNDTCVVTTSPKTFATNVLGNVTALDVNQQMEVFLQSVLALAQDVHVFTDNHERLNVILDGSAEIFNSLIAFVLTLQRHYEAFYRGTSTLDCPNMDIEQGLIDFIEEHVNKLESLRNVLHDVTQNAHPEEQGGIKLLHKLISDMLSQHLNKDSNNGSLCGFLNVFDSYSYNVVKKHFNAAAHYNSQKEDKEFAACLNLLFQPDFFNLSNTSEKCKDIRILGDFLDVDKTSFIAHALLEQFRWRVRDYKTKNKTAFFKYRDGNAGLLAYYLVTHEDTLLEDAITQLLGSVGILYECLQMTEGTQYNDNNANQGGNNESGSASSKHQSDTFLYCQHAFKDFLSRPFPEILDIIRQLRLLGNITAYLSRFCIDNGHKPSRSWAAVMECVSKRKIEIMQKSGEQGFKDTFLQSLVKGASNNTKLSSQWQFAGYLDKDLYAPNIFDMLINIETLLREHRLMSDTDMVSKQKTLIDIMISFNLLKEALERTEPHETATGQNVNHPRNVFFKLLYYTLYWRNQDLLEQFSDENEGCELCRVVTSRLKPWLSEKMEEIQSYVTPDKINDIDSILRDSVVHSYAEFLKGVKIKQRCTWEHIHSALERGEMPLCIIDVAFIALDDYVVSNNTHSVVAALLNDAYAELTYEHTTMPTQMDALLKVMSAFSSYPVEAVLNIIDDPASTVWLALDDGEITDEDWNFITDFLIPTANDNCVIMPGDESGYYGRQQYFCRDLGALGEGRFVTSIWHYTDCHADCLAECMEQCEFDPQYYVEIENYDEEESIEEFDEETAFGDCTDTCNDECSVGFHGDLFIYE